MLDDTRCGLDASSLHRATSIYNYIAKKAEHLSCHRDTSLNKTMAKFKNLKLSL